MLAHVGIIDSGYGYGAGNAQLAAEQLRAERSFTPAGVMTDRCGHGSAILNVVSQAQIQLSIAKVFEEGLTCPVERVCEAIDWLVGQGVHLINMSFGMPSASPRLARSVASAVASSVICIAAAPAQGAPVYPSSLPSVIRATGDARCGPHQISWLGSGQADVGGCPGNPETGVAGASIGCAHVAAFASRLLAQGLAKDTQEVLSRFKEAAAWHGPERRMS
jgi:hypothetical protein